MKIILRVLYTSQLHIVKPMCSKDPSMLVIWLVGSISWVKNCYHMSLKFWHYCSNNIEPHNSADRLAINTHVQVKNHSCTMQSPLASNEISHYKILLTFKCLHGLATDYPAYLIQEYNPSQNLQSSSKLRQSCFMFYFY